MDIQELDRVSTFAPIVSVLDRDSNDRSAWDDFVHRSPHGLPTHLSIWKDILSSVYQYPCYFLLVREGLDIKGVLPLFQINSPFTGHSLQSMPGGACAASEEAAKMLIDAADSLAMDLHVNFLLLRDSRFDWASAGLEALEAHRGVVLELSENPEEIWMKLPKDVRYHIRHGKKQGGVKIIIDSSRTNDFHQIFSLIMKNLGTPIFAKDFLQRIVGYMPESYQIALVFYYEKIIGGFFNFVMNRSIYGMWGGVLHGYKNIKATHQAYWAMIEEACQSGLTIFDMGRSPYPSSQYEFKEQWGDWTYPIFQLYKVYRGSSPRTFGVINSNHINSFVQWSWKHLPLKITQTLGPVIRRHIPFG